MAKWILSLVVVAAVLAGSALAQQEGRQRQRPDAGRGGMLQMLERAGIELTDDQKTEIEGIQAKMGEVFAKVREAEGAEARQKAMEEARPKMQELREQLEKVLTEDQRKKLEESRAQRQPRPARGEGERPARGRRPSSE